MNDRKSRFLTKNMEENKRKDFQNLYFIFKNVIENIHLEQRIGNY